MQASGSDKSRAGRFGGRICHDNSRPAIKMALLSDGRFAICCYRKLMRIDFKGVPFRVG